MFKIAKTNLSAPFVPGSLELDDADNELLTQYCVTERWTGDLSNGLFRLGDKAAKTHGLHERDCGLLNLIRCYEPLDRTRVLELFEQASTTCSSFCFSTTINVAGVPRQPVFCVGESTGIEQKYAGLIIGVFIFPRFQVELPAYSMKRQ
ncbi:hypothetical protein [Sinorhizobium sp. BG8]|uniref:hypothetical protein n=1 Tax=Sinorhizobium sp. BG8 TaxID=2613773 RepID=UPI00193CEA9F|nr:hypothetical protein [Sinorhizobium sp. BG8]QRM54462.1 hypothetical protein F3Y30_07815 [Sinorhizobium sp. BG8]